MMTASQTSTSHEYYMFREKVKQSLFIRKRAIHKLRMGDHLEHKWMMQDALLYLKSARQWRPKP